MNFDFLIGFSMALINTQKTLLYPRPSPYRLQITCASDAVTELVTETAWLQTPPLLMYDRTADIGSRPGSSLGVKWLLTNTTHKLSSEKPQEHCPSQEPQPAKAC